MAQGTDILDDLAAEYRRLDAVLAALTPQMWARPSAASGWSVCDVVLHLAQTEEFVLTSIAGERGAAGDGDTTGDGDAAGGPGDRGSAGDGDAAGERGAFTRPGGVTMDALAGQWVAQERDTPPDLVLDRWRKATAATPAALAGCAPGDRLPWATVPLSPRTLATTRLAEHWAHALDITVPLGIDYPDTARLWHIARLAQRTLPYAFAVAGEEGGPVRCELTGPGGEPWRFGDPEAPSLISGSAAEFCRVGARRLAPRDTGLRATGPHAAAALRVLRNYAA
ncbi:maleylpyruvate isomerase family mycothiol-dependent enzyme [Planobispora takensis]|uniref:TIGR03084 family protein n=1 Tax=Planobispora takensis TaxID=1367882 RepID=A0A8J3WWP1_9ACTN|nr:maleylpyruvate isomerase family mycothiol-dependent enzyme [Planobispora takensis]GII05184.1 TIGR03084 family protein [Planobispora takensis]